MMIRVNGLRCMQLVILARISCEIAGNFELVICHEFVICHELHDSQYLLEPSAVSQYSSYLHTGLWFAICCFNRDVSVPSLSSVLAGARGTDGRSHGVWPYDSYAE